jgi:hypothetical protein
VTTREEAIAKAGACIAEGRRVRDSLPVAEAARRAHRAGGPPLADLERRPQARPGAQTQTATTAA